MKILLIGSGGREHAIARSLTESDSRPELWCAPGNPGIFHYAKKAPIAVTQHQQVVEFCKEQQIDLVFIGPEQPLEEGLSDVLRIAGFAVFGPSKAAARLETSKGYAKDFMQRYDIPTAAYRRFTAEEREEATAYLAAHALPVVIKADGLAAGKGVVVAETQEQALEALDDMFSGSFGSAGAKVVIEEFLVGEEASVFAICDGSHFVTLASAQDHKRALDGDKGKNTGGMGTYAPAPIVSAEVMRTVEQRVIQPLLDGMQQQNAPFVGCLFVGLMIHEGEAKVVEFNVRFGDPETQSVLSILDADFAKLCLSAALGNVDATCIRSVATAVACTVVLASEGYPDSYEKGFPLHGIEQAESIAFVYHAGTALKDGEVVSNGGRVLGVTALAPSLAEAIHKSYEAVRRISYQNIYYRTDIGQKGLAH